MYKFIYSAHLLLAFLTSAILYPQIQSTTNDYDTISFNVDYKIKYLFEKDTVEKKYEVYLKKNNRDTLYHSDFSIIKDSTEVIYHLNNLTYHLFPLKKLYYILKKRENKIYSIISPIINLKKDLSVFDSIEKSTTNDLLTIKGQILNQKNRDIKSIKTHYEINVKTGLIIMKKIWISFNQEIQFEEWAFSNYQTKAPKFDDFFKTLSSYKMIEIKNNDVAQPKIDLTGLKGELLADKNLIIPINEYKNKVLLLDFWFIACYPCIESIPELNKLHEKYFSKGLRILGINQVDIDKKKILKFAQKYNISYPILLTKNKNAEINGYPTIFLIDRNKNIIKTYTGYSAKKMKKLEEDIIELLK